MLRQFQNDVFIEEFSQSDLKDARLNKRLQMIAKRMAKKPKQSISTQMESWKDAKGCYRFFNNTNVTHKRIQTPHRIRVKQQACQRGPGEAVLFIQDLSELDYSSHSGSKGLGQVGNAHGIGIQMHSCLAVVPHGDNPEVLGLAHQIVWERKEKERRGKPSVGEQFRANKESHVWSQTLRSIGSPPPNCLWVTVCDRGSDCGDYFFEAKKKGWEVVSRACQNRCVKVNNEDKKIMDWTRSLSPQGTYSICLRKKGEGKKRKIQLNIAWESSVMVARSKEDELELSVIRCWNDEEDIEWIIYSTIKVNTLEDAIEKIKWYAHRWIIEEYHKCVKTGCRIESRQLQTNKALESIVGVLGIIALLMLSLRNIAREKNNESAKKYVPEIALRIICHRFELDGNALTIYEFWRTVARMGGFLNRKSDGEPGWQTLWLGWLQLLNMMEGASTLLDVCGVKL